MVPIGAAARHYGGYTLGLGSVPISIVVVRGGPGERPEDGEKPGREDARGNGGDGMRERCGRKRKRDGRKTGEREGEKEW